MGWRHFSSAGILFADCRRRGSVYGVRERQGVRPTGIPAAAEIWRAIAPAIIEPAARSLSLSLFLHLGLPLDSRGIKLVHCRRPTIFRDTRSKRAKERERERERELFLWSSAEKVERRYSRLDCNMYMVREGD